MGGGRSERLATRVVGRKPVGRRRLLLLVAAANAVSGCGPHWPTLVHVPTVAEPALLVRDVGVLDVVAGRVVAARDVLVVGDRIVRIAATGAGAPPIPYTAVAGNGGTLVPGLIDMHVHVAQNPAPPWVGGLGDAEANLRAFLYAGVTTVLDLGDLYPRALERRERVARGELLGPRVLVAGPMLTARGGHPVAMLRTSLPWWMRGWAIPQVAFEIGSPQEGQAAAARVAAMGADFLKVVVDRIPLDGPRLDAEELRAVVGEARRRGLRALAHIGTTADALDAAEAGVAAWAHDVYKERIPDDQVARLAAFRIPMVPTLEAFDSMARAGAEPFVPSELEREIVPAEVLRALDEVPARWRATLEDGIRPLLRREREHWLENVRRLHDAGVVILAGSDTSVGVFPGGGLNRELHQLARAGLSNAEVLRAATLYAARFLADAAEPDFGLVEEGKRADLVLVDGNPLIDLDALMRVRAVVLGGVLLDRTAIGGTAG
jgi:imidazolonepropionase-like amidohydrolase